MIDIGLGTEKIGLNGSPTIVAKVVNIVSERPPVIMSEGHNEAALVDSLIANFKKGGNVLAKKEKEAKKEVERPDFPEKDFRDGAKGIMTWAEVTNGKISRPSLELLTPARNLANQLGNDTKVMTLIIGKNVHPLAQTLIEHGSDEVIVVENDQLEEYLVLPFSSIFAQIIKERKPEIALFAATTSGRELAPRIGVKTEAGLPLTAPVLKSENISIKKKKLSIHLFLNHGGQPMVKANLQLSLVLFVLRFQLPAQEHLKFLNVLREDRELFPALTLCLKDKDFIVEILKTVRGEGGLQNLFEADIIVSGGRGTTSDNLGLIKALVDELKKQGINAEWACQPSGC